MLTPLLTFALVQAVADTGKASVLYADCKNAIAMLDKTRSLNGDELWGAGRCVGFFNGWSSVPPPPNAPCDSAARQGTLMRVFIAYADRNPKILDYPEPKAVYLALVDAYPCPAK